MTTYTQECFKLRCMYVNWKLSQMALETAALCISRPQFQDLSQRKRITSRTPKMIQLWIDLRDFFQADELMGWVQHTDLTIFHMYQSPVAENLFHPFLVFIVLEFGGSNHHHLWTYSIQSLPLLWQSRQTEVDALEKCGISSGKMFEFIS